METKSIRLVGTIEIKLEVPMSTTLEELSQHFKTYAKDGKYYVKQIKMLE